MLKSFIGKFFMFVFFTAGGSIALGAEKMSCEDALAQAARDVSSKRDNAQPIQTSSTGQNGQQQSSGNPMTDIINKISEGQQKQAELAQKAAEQARQLDNDRFKQLNDLNDKIHEFQKGDYKRRIDIKDAQTALKKQQSTIRIKCQKKAEEDYAAEFKKNDILSQATLYSVSDMGHMAGTDKRMKASLALYRSRCLSNPAILEEKQNAQDEYDGKLHNFAIVAEEIASDVNYTSSKIDLVEAHTNQQKMELQASLAAQAAALQQQQTMQMIGLGFAMLSSASSNGDANSAAAEFNSADQILQNWNIVKGRCMDPHYDHPYAVPYDIAPLFEPVNNACRTSPAVCIKSSGKASATPGPGVGV